MERQRVSVCCGCGMSISCPNFMEARLRSDASGAGAGFTGLMSASRGACRAKQDQNRGDARGSRRSPMARVRVYARELGGSTPTPTASSIPKVLAWNRAGMTRRPPDLGPAHFGRSNRQSDNPKFTPAYLLQHSLYEVRRQEAGAGLFARDDRDHRLVTGAGHDCVVAGGKAARKGRKRHIERAHELELVRR